MAITVYKYDDLDAPDLAGEPNGQSLQALLEHVLVGQGWTIVHDTTRRGTGTSVDGRIIFERPDADFVFWMDNEGSGDFIAGLADAGFSDGSLAHPQTGERQNGSTTSLMRVDDSSPIHWAKWVALYDGASHTLIFFGARGSFVSYGQTSSSLQLWGYLGTLATPASVAYDIPAAYFGGFRASAGSERYALAGGRGTTLVRYDGSPSTDGTYLNGGSGFSSASSNPSYILANGSPAPPYLPMTRIGCAMVCDLAGGGADQSVEVGVLRGMYRDPLTSNAAAYFELNYPAEYAGNAFDNPLSIGGFDYYAGSVRMIHFMSTNPDDWVF